MPGTERQPSSHSDLPLRFENFGIDEDQQIVVRLRDIDDDHALVHVDLRCGQADARRRVHGLRHVTDELTNLIVDLDTGWANLCRRGSG